MTACAFRLSAQLFSSSHMQRRRDRSKSFDLSERKSSIVLESRKETGAWDSGDSADSESLQKGGERFWVARACKRFCASRGSLASYWLSSIASRYSGMLSAT